jgi:hypothetical protein
MADTQVLIVGAGPVGTIGGPLEVLEVRSDAVRQVYERDLVLVRPDLHVVWRGNDLSVEPAVLAATATGRGCADCPAIPANP